jgi:uncharacterized protein YeaO (DUF488 family)
MSTRDAPRRRQRRQIQVKRVYDAPQASDGMRVLVDRLWPRGLSKARAAADLWLKDAAPSDALRRWYGHDPRRWNGFVRKYRAEISRRDDVRSLLQELRNQKRLTLLYGSRDTEHNHALLLRDVLDKGDARVTRAKESAR